MEGECICCNKFACINVSAVCCWVQKTLLFLAYLKPKTMNVNQISLKQPLEKKNPTATRDGDTERIKAIPVNRSEPKNTSWSHLLDVCLVLRCFFFSFYSFSFVCKHKPNTRMAEVECSPNTEIFATHLFSAKQLSISECVCVFFNVVDVVYCVCVCVCMSHNLSLHSLAGQM